VWCGPCESTRARAGAIVRAAVRETGVTPAGPPKEQLQRVTATRRPRHRATAIRTPALSCGEKASQHTAEREAHQRQFHRRRPPPEWRKLRGKCAGVRQGASGTHPGYHAQNSEARKPMDKRRSYRSQAENCHASGKSGATTEAIATIARQWTSHRHSSQAHCQHRTEIRADYMPFPDQRWDRKSQDLNIEAIENDSQRRETSQQFLIG